MEVRHNTTLLEQAVEHVVRRAAIPAIHAEAEALHKRARATSFRRLATGGAVALAAVGIGLGMHLGLWEPQSVPADQQDSSLGNERSDASVSPEADTKSGSAEAETKKHDNQLETVETEKEREEPYPPPTEPPDKVTTNYNIFSSKTVRMFGKTWEITAGHFFEKESDPIWKNAWCYTDRDVKGVLVKVSLVYRNTPTAIPTAPIASSATLQEVGLTDAAALALATKCAWHDNKTFEVHDFSSPGRNPFGSEKPKIVMSGRTLYYSGDIDSDFLTALKKRDFDLLQINSVGGLITESLASGTWLRESGKNVEVKSFCLSACVFVLAGGARRTATEAAQIGVHRFHDPNAKDPISATEDAQVLSSEIISYLERMGVKTDLFHRMAGIPSQTMEFIDHDQLRQWNLLGGAEPPLPPRRKLVPPSPDELLTAFVDHDGVDVLGHDLPNMPNLNYTIEQCKQACASDPRCRALSYNKKAYACFLKSNATTVIANPIAFSSYDERLKADLKASGLDLYSATNLNGKLYRKVPNFGYVNCILLCERESRCQGFAFDHRQKACGLLAYVSGHTKSPDISSGAKRIAN